jgi:hypothetical protein
MEKVRAISVEKVATAYLEQLRDVNNTTRKERPVSSNDNQTTASIASSSTGDWCSHLEADIFDYKSWRECTNIKAMMEQPPATL